MKTLGELEYENPEIFKTCTETEEETLRTLERTKLKREKEEKRYEENNLYDTSRPNNYKC